MQREAEFFGTSIATHQVGVFAVAITDYLPGTAIEWHDHAGPYLTYVARGEYRERLRKSVRHCGAHSIVPHPSGEIHADEFRQATRCINIRPDGAWLSRWNMTFDDCRPVTSGVAASIMKRVRLELRRDDALSPMVAEALLLELMAGFAREQQDTPSPAWLRDVHEEVLTRFREPVTLRDLASAAKVHPVHLARAFRRCYGRTVGDLIRERRVDFAKSRIGAGCSLSDVALEAGFADQSHLTRTFRRLTGMTPAEFRRVHRVPLR